MKQGMVSTALGLTLAIGLSALAQDPGGQPPPRAAAVWDWLEQQRYQSWPRFPGTNPYYEGSRPHGARLTTYVNDVALNALRTGSGELPVGSFIVKENYTPDRMLDSVTVMYKPSADYDPDAGNWFWLKRLADGNVEASGRVENCQECHSESSRDYVLSEVP